MKKILAFALMFSIFAAKANAQNVSNQDQQGQNKSSTEEKSKMDKVKAAIENLSTEKKAEAKKEMERHRAAMKKITGVDLPHPPTEKNREEHHSIMKNLSAEKKAEAKKEMESHFSAMKAIGVDLPKPPFLKE